MTKRIRPTVHQLTVHQLKPSPRILVSIAEAQMIARRRAVVDLPTVQRDFSEVWGREAKRKKKRPA